MARSSTHSYGGWGGSREPLTVLPLLLIAALLQKETSARKPLLAVLAGCVVGFVTLTHAFSLQEGDHIMRYTFGVAIALGLAALLGAAVERPHLGHWRSREAAALALGLF